MAGRRFSVETFVLVLMFTFYGVKIAEGADWKKVRDLYVDLAHNGRKEGQSCSFMGGGLLTHSLTVKQMANIAGKEPSELDKEYPSTSVLGITYDASKEYQKDLDPKYKSLVCAAKSNLVCSPSDKCVSCKTADFMSAEENCKVVDKIVKAGSWKVNAVNGLLAATLLFLFAV